MSGVFLYFNKGFGLIVKIIIKKLIFRLIYKYYIGDWFGFRRKSLAGRIKSIIFA
jgi:hypothetical protein